MDTLKKNWSARGFIRAAMTSAMLAAAASNVDAAEAQAALAPQTKPAIVVLGDSLSAEYGLPRDTGWVNLLRERLAKERFDYSVANSSISGDTTSGGRARLTAVLTRIKPAVVIVELGANDALRGVPLATTETNLRGIVEASLAAHAKVLLIGMYVPSNYGPDYSQKFHAVYERIAKDKKVALVPFLLAGIADKPTMFQSDQIHPTVQAQPLLLNNVWPTLKPLLGAGASQ